MYDSQSRCKFVLESVVVFHRNVLEKLSSRYPVVAITYELNLLRSRGPRRMICTMDTIPVAAIQEVLLNILFGLPYSVLRLSFLSRSASWISFGCFSYDCEDYQIFKDYR
ncbi:hypothetical protein Leryth_022924 [Lithospermum erythrorhizon]|nr:hypothetical protein Leryth_022924 [Lithospermum erythrorhizon]